MGVEARNSSAQDHAIVAATHDPFGYLCCGFSYTGGGSTWAAITGIGLAAAPSTPLQIQKATLGSVQPVRTVEFTERKCELNALSRMPDDVYCDKYYVCSDDKYVGLFCPIGMAFDYGLQECRFKHHVDCSKRPLICKF